jgi:hypothetical protein
MTVYINEQVDNYFLMEDEGYDKIKEVNTAVPKESGVKEDFEKHTSGAVKETAGKIRLDLVPFEAIMEIGKVYSMGADKYEDHNWRKGLLFMKHHIGAALRHIGKFVLGLDKDDESGLPHLAHACFHLMAVMTHQVNGTKGLDDRVKI